MKELKRQLRLLFAERLIEWSLAVMPECPDKGLWARHVYLYMRGVERRTRPRRARQ